MGGFDRGLKSALEWLVSTILALIAIICFVEVCLRYGFNRSSGWYDEFVGYLLVWLTFFGAAMAQQRGAHIGIGNVLDHLPERGRQGIRIVNHVLLLGIHGVMLVYGTQLAVRFFDERAITLPIPMGWVYLVLPLSAAIVIAIELRMLAALFGWLPAPREDRSAEAYDD